VPPVIFLVVIRRTVPASRNAYNKG
jgi:hypothetical protein